MPRSPKKPATFRTTSSKPGMARSVLRAARSAGCSQARDEIWVRVTRGMEEGARDEVLGVRCELHLRPAPAEGVEDVSVRRNGLAGRRGALCPGHRIEAALEIREQVVHFLDPTRETNETLGNSESRADLRWNGRMGHRCGVTDQRFDTAQ